MIKPCCGTVACPGCKLTGLRDLIKLSLAVALGQVALCLHACTHCIANYFCSWHWCLRRGIQTPPGKNYIN
ncbi:hypothetical protein XENTR_v10003641 [Xenopus tropicalis]|nr:hypothetical protein XENTR_v10003641 [Xenopus tropicalis]